MWFGKRIFRSVEVIDEAYFQSHGVQARIGEFGITIREVGTGYSGNQVDLP